MTATPRCVGVILAGGGARRLGGQPKGLLLVEGARIIDRVATALREASDDLLLVANDPSASEWLPGVRTATGVGERVVQSSKRAVADADIGGGAHARQPLRRAG